MFSRLYHKSILMNRFLWSRFIHPQSFYTLFIELVLFSLFNYCFLFLCQDSREINLKSICENITGILFVGSDSQSALSSNILICSSEDDAMMEILYWNSYCFLHNPKFHIQWKLYWHFWIAFSTQKAYFEKYYFYFFFNDSLQH